MAIPIDARGAETTICHTLFEKKHLERFSEIALEDMDRFFKQRPELKKERFAVVLAQGAAEHYTKKKGFRCISLFTLFKKSTCRDFHPMRHTRIDFGSDDFGRSSWIKHPGDRGFKGRGINCYGRSIPFERDWCASIEQYLRNKDTLGKNVVVLWPPEHLGTVIGSRKRSIGE